MSAFFKLWGPSSGSIVPDSDNDGVPDNTDAYPNDPTRSVAPVPAIPLPLLLLLTSIFMLVGARRLSGR